MNRTHDPGRMASSAPAARASEEPQPLHLFAVAVQLPDALVEGYTEELDGSALAVQALGALPELGLEGTVTVYLPAGTARAQCKVTSVDAETRTFGLELGRLEEHGPLLLATELLIEPA